MFEVEIVRGALSLTEQLRHATRLRSQADSVEVQAIADLADEHEWTTESEFDVVGERPIRIGADGTRMVGEFLCLEVAGARGCSVTAATCLIRDVVDLKYRHPVLWQSVIDGEVPLWQASQLVRACVEGELTADEAAVVEGELATRYGSVSWRRVLRLARGLIARLAADRLAAHIGADRAARFLRSSPVLDNPVVSDVWGRIDTTDAVQLEATLSAVAKALADAGDCDELDVRKAKALGILASPARAAALLAGDPGGANRDLPCANVYLHLSDEELIEPGVARGERLGPIPTAKLKDLFGNHRIKVTPVLRVGGQPPVDNYEIPDRLREAVVARDGVEVFPWSARPARGLDLDHTMPYGPGAKGQTREDNLGPLSRRVHRAKTARLWHLEQIGPGIFHWRSPRGHRYRVGPDGTTVELDVGPIEVLVPEWAG